MGRTALWVAIAALACAGCTQTVVEDEGQHRIGIEYFNARPCVLVPPPTLAGTPAKPTSLGQASAMVVTLPDTAHPQYAVQRTGWGKTGFIVDCGQDANFGGYLKQFQLKDQSGAQVKEAISTIGNVATSIIGGMILRDQIKKID